MGYKQTLDFLYAQLPMYQRIGKNAYKKDLTNIRLLCSALGDPHLAYPIIHIAGTNGKGTVSHLVSAMHQASGKRVGLYTSPHYRDFRERMKINGEYISKQDVVQFVKKIKDVMEEIKPSFFELTVAMAFDYFGRHKVDIAVIETGLGGRLDSTNIVSPELCIITNISKDHTQILGETLPLIAIEKAGIIKSGVPVVIGEGQHLVDAIFIQTAMSRQAPIVFAEDVIAIEEGETSTIFSHENMRFSLDLGQRDGFLKKNITTALAAILMWNQIEGQQSITATEIQYALDHFPQMTNYIGRWQKLGEAPLIIADSAHNLAGIVSVLKHIQQQSFRKLHMVIGFVKEKDLDELLGFFPKDAKYYFVKPAIERGMDAALLAIAAKDFYLLGKTYKSVKLGLAAAKKSAGKEDMIFVGGSSFVVAEVV